jgi:hypothetical protein
MVIGAATIPHFWLLSGMVFLTILTIITVHEIRIRRTAQEAADLAETKRRLKIYSSAPNEFPEDKYGGNEGKQDG